MPEYLADALLACLSKRQPTNQSKRSKLNIANHCPNLFSPESVMHDYAIEKGKNRVVYATNPTLVRHDKESYSNTWNVSRSSFQDVEWMDETNILNLGKIAQEPKRSKKKKKEKAQEPQNKVEENGQLPDFFRIHNKGG